MPRTRSRISGRSARPDTCSSMRSPWAGGRPPESAFPARPGPRPLGASSGGGPANPEAYGRCEPSVRVEPRRRRRRIAAGRELLAGAAREDLLHRGLLGGRDPQVVLLLHGDLGGHIRAPVPLVRRQPGRRVTVPLGTVGARVDGEQVEGVVGESYPLAGVPVLGPLLPGVG